MLTPRSSKDPSRAPACERKYAYSSERSARQIGQKRLRENGQDYRLWPYACARCRMWHLTSMEQSGLAITAQQQREGLDDPS